MGTIKPCFFVVVIFYTEQPQRHVLYTRPSCCSRTLPTLFDTSCHHQSFRDGVILVLSTGYSMGCTAAIILNLIIPNEAEETRLPTKAAEVDQDKNNYPEVAA